MMSCANGLALIEKVGEAAGQKKDVSVSVDKLTSLKITTVFTEQPIGLLTV